MIGLRNDYSWPEGALSLWATGILTVLAATSLVLRYVTNPVSCHLPAQFEPSQVDYAQQFCFHTNQIVPPLFQHPLPPSRDELPPPFVLTYHQWLPFFLGVAATLCLLPHLTWRMVSCLLWMDTHELTNALTSNHRQNAAARHVMLRDCALLLRAGLKGGNSALAMAALGRKALGCVVCFLQMLLMLLVFAPQLDHQTDNREEESHLAGANDSVPLPNDAFLCSYAVWQMSRVRRYTVQCYMPLAQVYTKGLVFLVYLFLVLFVLCALDLTLCAMRLVVPRLKDMTLTRYLSVPSQSGQPAESPAHLARFLDSLGLDGRWVLTVVTDRCGAMAAADLTSHLFQAFKDSPRPAAPMTSAAHCSGAVPGSPGSEDCGGEAGTVPLITFGEKDGDAAAAAQDEEKKGEIC